MAKKKADAAETEGGAAPAETITKSEAVRRALAEGIESPTDGVAYIKDKFGIEMTNGQFSTVKFQENQKKGATPGKRGRKPGRKPRTVAASVSGGLTGGNGRAAGNPAELARAVKALVQQHGAEAVKDMAAVFAE